MRSRRDTELLLLGAAALPVLLVFALVQATADRDLAVADLLVPAGVIAAFAVVHLVARWKAPDADPALLPISALLSGIGLAFVTRLDPGLGASQSLWLVAGVAALAVTLTAVPSLETLARYKYTIMLAGLVLLLLPAFVGVEVNGARLWLRFAGMSFQPAEIAKLLVVLFLAAYLSENREVLSVSKRRMLGLSLPRARHLGPLLAMWAVSLVVLVAEKDLGSSLLFFGVFIAMIVTATGRPAYALVGMGLFAAGASVAYSVFSHVQDRISIWLDPFADASGRGYQLVQSLFALAAGGMAGVGIGRGFPERIPFVATDFVFSAIAEEVGLLGGAALIAAYLVLCVRGLAVAARARSDMAALTAAGLVAALGLQAFVIIGGVTRLIPLTGITLPFVSYGGSSIVSNFILLGLLMRAGDSGRQQPAKAPTGSLGREALVRRLANNAYLIAALMAALVLNATWVQVVRADALAAHPANTRALAYELSQERGTVLTSDGVVLARSVPAAGRFVREYPESSFAAHVLGYASPRFGRAGIEAAMNETLAGKRSFANLRDVVEAAAGIPVAGNDVVLTIDSRVQAAAEEALAGERGAIVALDPSTGAILAYASAPEYDPGQVDARFDELSSDEEGAPLVDRAGGSTFPPGSTFKVVTLAAALAKKVATPDTTYVGSSPLTVGGGKITNYGGNSYGAMTVRKATMSSVNTIFAQIAGDVGAEALVEQAEGFGFDETPPLEIPTVASVMSRPEVTTEWELGWAGAGQPVGMHDPPVGPSVTPLQMALVAAGIGNGGVVMQPHLVEAVQDHGGRVIARTQPKSWKQALDAATAATVTDIMVDVVAAGTGRRAAISGVEVAGKTGTAEVGKDLPTHAWFVAFAPADSPKVVVAVLVESGGSGGTAAAPLARLVMEAALSSR